MKNIPIIALVVAVAALGFALRQNEVATSSEVSKSNDAMQAEVQELRERLAALESTRISKGIAAPNIGNLEQQVGELANNQQDIAELALGIDSLGVLETQEREILNAYKTLLDESKPVGERLKRVALLKRYGQFDQQAVDSMWKLFSEPKEAYDQAGALMALKGHLTMDDRDDVLTALNEDMEKGYKNGRLRYHGIEAVESLLPDPTVQEWLTHLAQNDPEPKIAGRAARSVGLPIPKGRPKGNSRGDRRK
ncbi:MAG: hypothetical protein HN457_03425 [Opitutales bacterium]|jgi:hypothetical protein|nr:hypothetical protein [Opitutales bacterium]MBT5816136.1 hypothetical protein [Opitutales bacterium]MBT6769712.1 hypothetical protein [Opitutales bacterium]MDG2255353.1 hypothetical protein [Opitutaceae bacterium]